MKRLFACLLVCLVAPKLFGATPPTYDGFVYPAGSTTWAPNTASNFNAQGYYWNAVGTTTPTPAIPIASQNLSVPGLLPSTGLSIRLVTNGNSVRFSFPAAASNGPIYFSFALRVEDVGQTLGIGPIGGGFWAGFNNTAGTQPGTPTIVGTKVLTRATTNSAGARDGGYNLGMVKASTTASDFVWDSRRFTSNDIVFIVGCYTFVTLANTTDDLSKLWINPAPATFGAAGEPAPDLTSTKGTDLLPIASFVFLQRNRPDVQPSSSICDELRIGNTWADVTPPAPALAITCPASVTTTATSASGAVVTYPLPTVSGGCDPTPPTPACNPPSGSTFPVGTSTVTCFANGSCGGATCTFTVTVTPPPAPEYFSSQPLLPPPASVYISPAQWHVLFAQGIIIRDVRHRFFTQHFPLPPLGTSQSESFSSEVDFEVSTDNGGTFQPASGTANVTVQVTHSQDVGSKMVFSTEMLQLDLTSGGMMLRESPTLHSTGQTTVRPVAGGYMISSFFDVFTEVSVNGGASWQPAQQAGHVEMHPDPLQVTPVSHPTPLLPPPNGGYVSPAQWHALYAQGIIIRDVRHKFFTGSLPPPPPGGTQTENFNSQIDLQVSTDGGNTFQAVRVAAPVQVTVASHGSSTDTIYDTEMTSLTLNLPNGVMIRESPTEPSRGQTEIDLQSDGTYKVSSFFDIFPEVSLNGGGTWSAATNGPVRMALVPIAPEVPKPNPNLPPLDGSYVSPAQWHAYYANGIIITNASHDRFTQTQPPPPPGGSQTEGFGSRVTGQVSMNGGASFQPFSAPASVSVAVTSRSDLDTGATRFFDTEMLSLSLSGGTLPGGIMVRESPSKASLGRTSVRTTAAGYEISSFFDVFTEVSLDGGVNWSPQTSQPAGMALVPTPQQCSIAISCPADIVVNAASPAGAVVTYPAPTVVGSCGPFNVACNPPSGSTFPIGATVTTCTASDSLGNSASCSFKVTVRATKPGFFPNPLLPPPNGVYITPQLYHQLYANGIIIRDIKHRRFVGSQPAPAPGEVQVHQFGSVVELEHSMDGGATFQKVSAPANCTVRVSSVSSTGGFAAALVGTQAFDTEMLALDIAGGSLPAGVMIRESPTLASTGQTTVRQVGGGYMIDSFFDIFTEISTDGGANWSPAQGAAHVELRPDVALITPIPAAASLLPPPDDAYISPAQYHILTAQGIVIKDVRHSFFTHSMPPPPPGATQIHQFDSQVDMMLSQDGGNTFRPVRAPGAVVVEVEAVGSPDSGLYDTEMLSLNIQGGDLPAGVMIRESPTEPSRGQTEIDAQADGTYRIGSFFDIFPEVSLDGGQSWVPAQSPAHVELVKGAPEQTEPNPNLPPLDGKYVSPAQWHAYYANGIIISNASHDRFTQTQPPPPPGGSQTENFGSRVSGQISLNGGASFTPFSAPASVAISVQSRADLDTGNTRFFDTEMLALSVSGGTLPGGIMVRESPSKASLGRTSVRTSATGYQISSFFDIFPEVSIDGGQNWLPSQSLPTHMSLGSSQCIVLIACPADITAYTGSAAGKAVTFAPTVGPVDTCNAPVTVVCNPPSGSTFPVGTTTVTCTASSANGSATCSFTVTVKRLGIVPHWFPTPLLPPPQGEYISPQKWHQLYANGIIISNVSHRRFLQSFPAPQPFTTETHSFGSEVAGQISMDGGQTFVPLKGSADVTVRVTHTGTAGGTQMYDTEMLALNLTTANGVMVRESPSKASLGKTTVTPNPGGGFAIGSFFDVFTEISLDGGVNWSPAQDSAPVELQTDAQQVTPITLPTPLLPPPNDLYVSPQLYHILLQNGIVIRNVRHKLFTQSLPPPQPGVKETHSFGSQVDLELSQDGGNTFRAMRAPAQVSVSLELRSTEADGTQTYDTEMLQLDIQGGDLPAGLMIRESPTLPSKGSTAIAQADTDGDGVPDAYRIGSFFDIFPEVTLDGGQTWTPAQTPAHVELICEAPPIPLPDPNLPPLNGQYISPQLWHALYQQGIIISNVSHKRFTQNFPPPPPGATDTHSFGSQVECDLSMNNGQSWQHTILPAQVTVSLREMASDGSTRFFDTEMLALNIQGGVLPAGTMIRESPSKASLGRTSVQTMPDGTYRIGSFFDVFTELTIDGGQTWSPSLSGPGTVHVAPIPTSPLTVTCPPNKTITASGPAGAIVNYASPTTAGGCPPATVVCNPPSGSTFPVGTTTVTCIAHDICNGSATCVFNITVNPPVGNPCFEPDNGSGTVTLPPQGCQYLSPDEVHMIIDGLPPGTTVVLAAIHKEFICHQQGGAPCSNDCFTVDDCNPANGATEQFQSTLQLQLHGTGALAGWDRTLSIPNVFCQSQVGPRTPGMPVQSFDTDMQNIQGQLPPGDPDFDLLRITAGSGFGLPSPGHTTLTRQPGGNWAIDSFFDITYRIDFIGHPGGHVGGMSGSTTGTIRMIATPSTGPLGITCPPNKTITASGPAGAIVNYPPPTTSGGCTPVNVVCNPPSGSTFPVGTTTVACTASDSCNNSAICLFDVVVNPPVGNPCFEPDNGSGTVTLPPQGCQYLSPDQVHMIIDGLPPGTTVELAAIHKEFICKQAGPCAADCFTTDDCNPANGATEQFNSTLQLRLHGTGALAGWDRTLSIPNVFCQSQVGPRTPGAPVQSFDTEMQNIQGQLPPGDPDFDLLRITAGTGFGLPSPGHTTLTRQAGGNWAVDSFFDITYRIDFIGHGGGHVGGMSGSTTGTIRMVATPSPALAITCPPDKMITASGPAGAIVNYAVTTSGGCPPVNVVCNPPSGSTFPVGTTTVTCTASDACGQTATCTFNITVKPPVGNPCFEPDNGSGTVTLPPQGCQYLSPDQVHMIIDGLPPGTTVELAAIHKEFICHQQGGSPCNSNDCFTVDDCNPTNGATEQFNSTLQLQLHGTGALAGWDRTLSIPNMFCQSQVAGRTPGMPVQSFDTEMQNIQGQLPPGDPDFDLLRITAGSGFGMPSPGHTTLTRQAGGNWAVDSFFDITYRIDFIGHSGGHVGGMSGSTTGTIRMVAVPGTPCVQITCPTNITTWTCNPDGTKVTYAPIATNTCGGGLTVACAPPSGSNFPVGATPVTCTATDGAGSAATCTFTVTVRLDTLAPKLTCPNDVVIRTCNERELVFYTVTVSDDCDPSPSLVCNPPSGSSFPLGSTPVNCTATDACGHKTNCTFIVVVIQEPVPRMTITLLPNNQIRICWNTVCPGYLLQCTKGLETLTMWETITNAPLISNNTNYCVTLPLQPNRRFYRLIRRTPQEVFTPTNTLPPVGSYNSPSGEVTVFANGLVARWFVHRIPPQPCPPNCPIPPCPTCPDPIILTFSTALDFQYSTDGGKTFQNANTGNFDTRVAVHGSISGGQIGPVGTLDMEILSMTISSLPGGVMIRESPTLASTGKHRIRTIDGGYMVSSFFDVFLELSTDGGGTWSPSLGSVHVDFNPAVPTIPSGSDSFPPAGSYNSISNVPTRYLNGLIVRNFRHVVPPLPCPPSCPPPCLICLPGQYDFPTTLSFQVSTDGGLSFQDVTVQNVQSRARARHTQDTSDTRFFDTELLSLQLPPLAAGVMLRESPTRASTGKTTVQTPAGSTQFRIGSFFDVFTEVSLDGGQTWSPVVDPTHLELNPQPLPPGP